MKPPAGRVKEVVASVEDDVAGDADDIDGDIKREVRIAGDLLERVVAVKGRAAEQPCTNREFAPLLEAERRHIFGAPPQSSPRLARAALQTPWTESGVRTTVVPACLLPRCSLRSISGSSKCRKRVLNGEGCMIGHWLKGASVPCEPAAGRCEGYLTQ